jgi:plasmid stability protein
MASLTIRNVDDDVKSRLRLRAAEHGHSMEEEARVILREALQPGNTHSTPLAQRIQNRFAAANQLADTQQALPIPIGRAIRPEPDQRSNQS